MTVFPKIQTFLAPVGQRSKKDINRDIRKILFPCDLGPNDTGGDDGAQNERQEKKVLYEKTVCKFGVSFFLLL